MPRMADRDLRRDRDRRSGFTLIELMIVIAIIAISAAIALPNLLESRKSANESAAIAALRTIVTAQAIFRDRDRDGDVQLDYAQNVGEHGSYELIDEVLAAGEKQGYTFDLHDASSFVWHCHASPTDPGKSGDRYFFVDQSGVIRWNAAAMAEVTDPPLGSGPAPTMN